MASSGLMSSFSSAKASNTGFILSSSPGSSGLASSESLYLRPSALDFLASASSSSSMRAAACCISKMASSQKLTKASSFSLSPSVTMA
ncbi:hypothetical protein E2C01_004881 [Portunus trituberculatus]|uniref:Uncharacterized protein n=1 Tax=Portunus trituberculatus TaxID=210409 RepID=A0A5B7CU59_PORTR|nr:hypothetical protein [Portunus trituberculatus]